MPHLYLTVVAPNVALLKDMTRFAVYDVYLEHHVLVQFSLR